MKLSNLFLTALFLATQTVAHATSETSHHSMMGHTNHQQDNIIEHNTLKLALKPNPSLKANSTSKVIATLDTIANRKPVTLKDLKEAHTKKLHLLIIDPSLSDYHHIHPDATTVPGEYVFDFTPLKNNSYRVWADVIPVTTNKQEYVRADMGTPAKEKAIIDKTTNTTSTVGDYTFTLKLDSTPKANGATMATVTITKDGKPFTKLEPVMGAFAHIVGFPEDYESVVHIHPMGKEPTKNTERGGPDLPFHMETENSGFVKLFVQVRIDDKDIFAPFGIMVK